jgi:hypothetical protein
MMEAKTISPAILGFRKIGLAEMVMILLLIRAFWLLRGDSDKI